MPRDPEGQVLLPESTDNHGITSGQEHPPHGFLILKKQMKDINSIRNSGNSCNEKWPRVESCPTWQGKSNPLDKGKFSSSHQVFTKEVNDACRY